MNRDVDLDIVQIMIIIKSVNRHSKMTATTKTKTDEITGKET